MSWEERILLGINIEYLWRCMLLSQDKILSTYDQYMNGVIGSKFSEYDKDKEQYVDSISSLKAEILQLQKKVVEIK